jgi:anti-sigma factor RsiW
MTSPPKDMDDPVDRMALRDLWQRCRTADAPEDEHLRFVDLAAFAEGSLDPDEHERIEALLLSDPIAAADVAAARALRGSVAENPASIERIVARASALRPAVAGHARILSFPGRRQRLLLRGLAQWGSLAAALAMAAWLGFTMGSDASLALSRPTVTGQDGTVIELFDPATGFLHDMPAGVQT